MKNMRRKINKVLNKNNKMKDYSEAVYFEMTKSYDTSAQSRELYKNEAAWVDIWKVWNR